MDGGNNGKPYLLMDDLGENPLFSETPIYYISKKSTNEIMGKSLLTLLTLVDLDHPPPTIQNKSQLTIRGWHENQGFYWFDLSTACSELQILSAKIHLLYGKILFFFGDDPLQWELFDQQIQSLLLILSKWPKSKLSRENWSEATAWQRLGTSRTSATWHIKMIQLRRNWNTLPETNIASENGWLEYYFPIGARPIFMRYVGFREGKDMLWMV